MFCKEGVLYMKSLKISFPLTLEIWYVALHSWTLPKLLEPFPARLLLIQPERVSVVPSSENTLRWVLEGHYDPLVFFFFIGKTMAHHDIFSLFSFLSFVRPWPPRELGITLRHFLLFLLFPFLWMVGLLPHPHHPMLIKKLKNKKWHLNLGIFVTVPQLRKY